MSWRESLQVSPAYIDVKLKSVITVCSVEKKHFRVNYTPVPAIPL